MIRCLFAGSLVLWGIAFLLIPHDAFAWGPGVHMATSGWLLGNLSLLPASLAASIMAFPDTFRYGALSADIFIGKGSTAKPGHSHNWSTGHALLEQADTPELQAYAAGYLAHLAADTVAHNYYVPTLLALAPQHGKLAHVYIEMQADRLVRWDTTSYRTFKRARKADSLLLEATQKRKIPFCLKKQIFKGSVAVSGCYAFRRSLAFMHHVTPYTCPKKYLTAMLDMSGRAILDVLSNPYDSVVLEFDPVGTLALGSLSASHMSYTEARCALHGFGRFPLDARLHSLPQFPEGMSVCQTV